MFTKLHYFYSGELIKWQFKWLLVCETYSSSLRRHLANKTNLLTEISEFRMFSEMKPRDLI